MLRPLSLTRATFGPLVCETTETVGVPPVHVVETMPAPVPLASVPLVITVVPPEHVQFTVPAKLCIVVSTLLAKLPIVTAGLAGAPGSRSNSAST